MFRETPSWMSQQGLKEQRQRGRPSTVVGTWAGPAGAQGAGCRAKGIAGRASGVTGEACVALGGVSMAISSLLAWVDHG